MRVGSFMPTPDYLTLAAVVDGQREALGMTCRQLSEEAMVDYRRTPPRTRVMRVDTVSLAMRPLGLAFALRRGEKIKVCETAEALMEQLFLAIAETGLSYKGFGERCGVAGALIGQWRRDGYLPVTSRLLKAFAATSAEVGVVRLEEEDE